MTRLYFEGKFRISEAGWPSERVPLWWSEGALFWAFAREGCTEQTGVPSLTGHKESIWVSIVQAVPPLQFCLIMMKTCLHIRFPRAQARRVVISTEGSELWHRVTMVWIVFQRPKGEDVTRMQLKNPGSDRNVLEKKGPLVSMRNVRGASRMSLWSHGALKQRGRQEFLPLHPILAKNKQDQCKAIESHSGRWSCSILHSGAEGGGDMEAWDMRCHGVSFTLASWQVGRDRVLSEKGTHQWAMYFPRAALRDFLRSLGTGQPNKDHTVWLRKDLGTTVPANSSRVSENGSHGWQVHRISVDWISSVQVTGLQRYLST